LNLDHKHLHKDEIVRLPIVHMYTAVLSAVLVNLALHVLNLVGFSKTAFLDKVTVYIDTCFTTQRRRSIENRFHIFARRKLCFPR
jgi:hypothetical protein